MSVAKHPGEHGPAAGAGHEQSDLQPRTVAIFGIALAVTVVVCLLLTIWVFDFLAAREAGRDIPPSPLAQTTAPAEPRLQVSAPKDMATFRADEEKILNGYEWLNRQAGTVRIPIDRAMQLLTERGLPTAGQSSQPTEARRK
jgi:hypothetical protein